MKIIQNNAGTCYFYPCENPENKIGTIVFIHGFATNSSYHDDYFAIHATKKYDYYSLQLPGHGIEKYNEKSKIEVDFYTKYCVNLIKTLPIDKFYLIGHSMGGGLGIRVANKLSNQVIAYVAVTPMNSKLPIKTIFNYWKFTPKNFKKTLKLNMHLYTNLHETKQNENVNDYIENELKYQLKHRGFFIQLKKDMFSLKNLNNCKKNECLINIPTLAIAGKYDPFIPYKSVYKALKKNKNDIILFELFENSSHIPFQEEQERYIKTVLGFFESVKFKKT